MADLELRCGDLSRAQEFGCNGHDSGGLLSPCYHDGLLISANYSMSPAHPLHQKLGGDKFRSFALLGQVFNMFLVFAIKKADVKTKMFKAKGKDHHCNRCDIQR